MTCTLIKCTMSRIATCIPLHEETVKDMQSYTGIRPTEGFLALQTSRGRVGTPPQKPWVASMELCCRKLGLNPDFQ